MECLTKLVNLKDLCTDLVVQPYFYLDDAEGLDTSSLAQLTKPSNGSGKNFGTEIIEASSRFLIADIETLIPKGFSIKSSLNAFCNSCTYTGVTSSSPKTGVVVKNISTSTNAFLSIDSLKIMIQSSGTFTVVLDDGIEPKSISQEFTAGTEVILTNINFKTSSKSVKIYFLEDGVLVTALSCPTTKSCGCSGQSTQSKDLQVKGLLNNAEFTTQYAFIPCASVVCSLDNILCTIVNQQPRLFAAALYYRSVARIYAEPAVTQRNNAFASFSKEEKAAISEFNMNMYYEVLRGSDRVKGIADNMGSALNSVNDPCVECRRQTTTAWGIG